MSTYAADAGSRYLVKSKKLKAAYEWLEAKGEFAHVVGAVRDCVVLSDNNYEDMFCGYVTYSVGNVIEEFLKRFCEPGSYACQHFDEFDEYAFYWKDGDGVHSDYKTVDNPFAEDMLALENGKPSTSHKQECPRCGEKVDVDGGHVNIDRDTAWQQIRCCKCGCVYTEVYRYERTEIWDEEEA